MLLRRVIEHVKAQNWFAVGLDLAVVILGVFIGFQVDRFYEAARLSAEEQEYLKRLHIDMTQSINTTQRSREFIRRNETLFGLIADSLETCELPKDKRNEFATGLYHIGKFGASSFFRGTLDEMLSTGKLGLIKNTQLRDLLNETIREIESHRDIRPKIQGRMNEQHAHMDRQYVFRFKTPPGAVSDVNWADVDVDFRSLRADEDFQAGLSLMRQMSYVSLTWYDRNLANFEKSKAALEAELGLTALERR